VGNTEVEKSKGSPKIKGKKFQGEKGENV